SGLRPKERAVNGPGGCAERWKRGDRLAVGESPKWRRASGSDSRSPRDRDSELSNPTKLDSKPQLAGSLARCSVPVSLRSKRPRRSTPPAPAPGVCSASNRRRIIATARTTVQVRNLLPPAEYR